MKKFCILAFSVIAFFMSAVSVRAEGKNIVCLNDFDPDDAAWVLASIERPAGNLATAERKFLYQPHDRRAKFLRRAPAENCWGVVRSYELPGYKNSGVLKEKRVRMQLHTSAGDTFYLMMEDGKWLYGTHIVETGDYSQTKPSKLRLTLYNGKKVVGERTIFVPSKEKGFKLEFNIQIN